MVDRKPTGAAKRDADGWSDGLTFLDAPAPRPTGRRPYEPKRPEVPGLVEAVWDSYNRGEYKLIPVPSAHVEALRAFLLQAKNWLNWKHGVDIRGLEKKDIEVIDPKVITDPEIRRMIPRGHVAVRFIAREPMNKGMRARQAKLAARGEDRQAEITRSSRSRRPAAR